jgi:hypothetical protein
MTTERLRAFGEAWRCGDVDALMSFMTEDCVFRSSVGPGPGADFHGPDAVRIGFELMLEYDARGEGRDGDLLIAGDLGASRWSYARTEEDGRETVVRGCDLFEFVGDRIRVKDAYRKVDGDIGLPATMAGSGLGLDQPWGG